MTGPGGTITRRPATTPDATASMFVGAVWQRGDLAGAWTLVDPMLRAAWACAWSYGGAGGRQASLRAARSLCDESAPLYPSWPSFSRMLLRRLQDLPLADAQPAWSRPFEGRPALVLAHWRSRDGRDTPFVSRRFSDGGWRVLAVGPYSPAVPL